MVKDWPLFNWKVLEATGEPLSSRVHVPELGISLPILVITKVPCASGVQEADSDMMGGVGVGVAVGDWQKVEIDAGAAPPPEVSSSKVPNSPLVWMVRDWLAFNWKVLEATGEPLSSRVQVPELAMSPPILVIVNVPWASGVQLADIERVGASVGVNVGVAVGDWQKVDVEAGAAPPPEVSSSNVP